MLSLPSQASFAEITDRNPIFIVGMNGSGTTMLLDCLDHHSQLYGFPRETRLIPHLIASAPNYAPLSDPDNFRRLWRYATRLAPFRLENDKQPMPLPENWQSCTRDLAGLLNMLLLCFAARDGKLRWCEKSPQYAQHMLKLAALFPEARFIHLIRDGRDCAYSFHRRWRRSPELTITRWKQLLRTARIQGSGLGVMYMEVRYEDLTLAPEFWMRKICAFIDLPFEPAVLQSSRPYLAAEGAGMQSNSGKWRKYFSARQADRLERIAGQVLVERGYPTDFPEGDETPAAWRQRGWKLADASRQQLREISLKLQGRIARPWWSILSRPINAIRQERENER